MIDYEKIGMRIYYRRKHVLKISQIKMAGDLLMYQPDISNIEKAKKGSGIQDLDKLDSIASYLGISLADLLFGEDEESSANPELNYKENEVVEMGKKVPDSHRRVA